MIPMANHLGAVAGARQTAGTDLRLLGTCLPGGAGALGRLGD